MRERIAYISSRLPSVSETFVYREVRALRERGWDVHVVALRGDDEPLHRGLADLCLGRIVLLGSGVWRSLLSGLVESIGHPLRTLVTLALAVRDCLMPGEVTPFAERAKTLLRALMGICLAGRLRTRQVRHLHCHFAHAPTSVGMYAARQLGIPFSFTGHANDIFQRRTLLKLKLARAAGVACISHWHKDFYRRECPSGNYHLVRCGVDTQDWAYRDADQALGTPIRLFTVCRLVRKKGVDLLIRALASMEQTSGPPWDLTVIGDGSERKTLEALAASLGCSGDITWLGSLDNSEVRSRLRRADIFVLPCRVDSAGDRDGIPVVLMEAMAMGIPVITGDIESLRELVQHEETGLVVDAEDPEALAEAIRQMAGNVSLRRKLAERAREVVESEFDADVNIDRLERMFASGHAADEPLRLAYLNTAYPSLSHTFIEREIRAVRKEGITIQPFSLRRATEADLLTEEHRVAAAETCVLQDSLWRLLAVAAWGGLLAPLRAIRVFAAAPLLQSNGPWSWLRAMAYAVQAIRLTREMDRRGIAHVHVHMANNGAAVAALACIFDRSKSYSLSIHGSAEFYQIRAWRLVAKVQMARFVRCISRFCKSQIMIWTEPAYWHRLPIVHCGVDIPRAPATSRISSGGPLRIITIGRMEPIKGYPVLLDACRVLTACGIDWTLTMVGGGVIVPLLEAAVLRHHLSHKVEFTGPLGQGEVQRRLEASDVMVVSSFMEGIPVVLMEAMAQGVIVVATAVGGIFELIEHGRNGFLVRPNDPEALAATLAEVVRRRSELAEVAANARHTVELEFNQHRTGQEMAALFRKYLSYGSSVPGHSTGDGSISLPEVSVGTMPEDDCAPCPENIA